MESLRNPRRHRSDSSEYASNMATQLPMDLIFTEILPRLPVKSLLRFKSVSKYWQTQISSPEFINLHLRYSQSSDCDPVLILTELEGRDTYLYHSINSPKPVSFHLKLPFLGHSDDFVIGSCNGLFCIGATSFEYDHNNVHHEKSTMMLLNPLTRMYKEIPMASGFGWTEYEKYGFGFDSVSDDYKVVRIMYHIEFEEEGDIVHSREVWIYSFKADSWRRVEFVPYPNEYTSYKRDRGTLIDNYLLHWQLRLEGSSEGEYCRRIHCFDLRKEQWTDNVPLPGGSDGKVQRTKDVLLPGGIDENVYIECFGVIDGCLCLLVKRKQPSSDFQLANGADVWIMKEYGVKESWMKLVVTFSESNYAKLIDCRGSRSEIFFTTKFTRSCVPKLLCYKRGKNKERLLCYKRGKRLQTIQPIHEIVCFTDSSLCNGSLVTVPGGTKFEL